MTIDRRSKLELSTNELNAKVGELNMVIVGVGVNVTAKLLTSLKDIDKLVEVGTRIIELARVTGIDPPESKELVLRIRLVEVQRMVESSTNCVVNKITSELTANGVEVVATKLFASAKLVDNSGEVKLYRHKSLKEAIIWI